MRVPVPCSVAASASVLSRPQQAVRACGLLLGAHVRVRLELVGEGVLLVERGLVLADDHLQLVLHRQLVAVPDHLRQLVVGVDVDQRERHVAEERLARQPQQDRRVLADRPQHAQALEVPEGLAEDEDALLFELVEVVHGAGAILTSSFRQCYRDDKPAHSVCSSPMMRARNRLSSAPRRGAAGSFDSNGRSTVTVVPMPGCDDDLERAAVRAHPLAHADHAQVTLGRGGLQRAADVEAAAVVPDRQRDARRRRRTMRTLTCRADAWRSALVIDSCATRKQAISSSDGRRPSRRSGVFSVPSSSSIATPDSAGLRFQVGAQRRDQADLVEQRRPQIDRHLAHAGDQVVDQRDRLADAVGRRRRRRARPAAAAASARSASAPARRAARARGSDARPPWPPPAAGGAAPAARRRRAACPAPRWRRCAFASTWRMTESIINASSTASSDVIAAIRIQFCIIIGSTSLRVEVEDAAGHQQADHDVRQPPTARSARSRAAGPRRRRPSARSTPASRRRPPRSPRATARRRR